MKLTASFVPHSSVVGSSIKLCDETGMVVAMLAILVPNRELDYETVAEAVADDILWKLGKRPVAFRLKNNLGVWVYYENEEKVAAIAEECRDDYQALYVRDGT
jgi:hypothetical protein